MTKSMVTDRISIEVTTVDEAPRYTEKDKTPLLKIDKAIIVQKGTRQGNSTVDLQLSDSDGNQFVILATGNILKSLGKMIQGVDER